MKILVTTDAFPPGAGGSGQSTAVLSRALARRGHGVTVVVSKPWDPSRVEEKNWQGIPVVEVGVGESRLGSARRREARLASFLKGWAPEARFDLAHGQHWLSGGATIRAGRKVGFPVVLTVRDYWPVCIWSTMLSGDDRCPGCSYTRRIVCVGRRHSVLWPVTPFLPPIVGAEIARRLRTLRGAAAVVAVSGHVQKMLPVEHVSVLPNLLDLEAVEESLGKPAPMLPDDFILFVGKLEPNKAPDRALSVMRESGVGLPLLIAGTGRLESSLREEAWRLGIDVRMLGWVSPDMALILMHRATAVLFPSRWEEPLSRVLLEGLGAGAVLIAEPSGGSGEIVVDQDSGLLASSVQGMAAALRRVLDEPELASRLRRGAVERARDRFSEDVVLPRLEAIYRQVLDGK
jgi:glycosyltransferase involved in cell wall biosynthesis